jgi:transketolase
LRIAILHLIQADFIMTDADHSRMANAIRGLAMDAVEKAKSGHPGLPMGAADIATVLFTQFLKFDAANPKWPDRDRFVLSAGHGSMLLYALLYLTGNTEMTLDQLKHFRQLGSLTPGHPRGRWARALRPRSGWRWPKRCWPRNSARRSSIIILTCSLPTAT